MSLKHVYLPTLLHFFGRRTNDPIVGLHLASTVRVDKPINIDITIPAYETKILGSGSRNIGEKLQEDSEFMNDFYSIETLTVDENKPYERPYVDLKAELRKNELIEKYKRGTR